MSTEVTVSTTTEWQTLSTPPLTRARSKKETQEDTSTRREDESRGEGDKPTRERTSEAAGERRGRRGRRCAQDEEDNERATRALWPQCGTHARGVQQMRRRIHAREGEGRLKPPTLPSLPSPPLPQHAQANQPTPTPSPKNPLRNWIPRSLWQSFLIITSASFLLSPSLAPSLQRSSSRQRGGRDTGEGDAPRQELEISSSGAGESRDERG